MMSRRNRLRNYRKHAKEGKLDLPNDPMERAQKIANLTGQPVTVVSEKVLGTKSADSTQSDSVQTGKDTITEFLADLASSVGAIHDRRDLFQAASKCFDQFLRRQKCMLAHLAVVDDLSHEVLTAFNPHFYNCGCKGCRQDVYLIKAHMSNTNAVGVPKGPLNMEKLSEDFERDNPS